MVLDRAAARPRADRCHRREDTERRGTLAADPAGRHTAAPLSPLAQGEQVECDGGGIGALAPLWPVAAVLSLRALEQSRGPTTTDRQTSRPFYRSKQSGALSHGALS